MRLITEELVGKTIKSVNNGNSNSIQITFTDGTIIVVESFIDQTTLREPIPNVSSYFVTDGSKRKVKKRS